MLKKIAAILLLLLLLFNWFGYRFALNYLLQKTDQQLEARIDTHDYDELQLIEIRVALNIPYQNTWTAFERCYGEIEINGQYYTYVKRKIEENYLILKCIPNHQKQVIKNADNSLCETINGISQGQNRKNSSSISCIKNGFNDYDDVCIGYNFKSMNDLYRHGLTPDDFFLPEINQPVCKQPPETSFFV